MAVSNLKQAMALYGVTEEALARQLHIDRGNINRWKSGERTFGPDSPYPRQIAAYLLSLPKARAREALMALAAPEHPLRELDPASDGLLDAVEDWLRHRAGAPDQGIPEALHNLYFPGPEPPDWPNRDAKMPRAAVGHCDLDALFRHLLFAMREGGRTLVVHICADDGVLPIGSAFTRFWVNFTGGSGPVARVVVAQGHKQGELNRLLSQWVPLLSRGRVELLCAPDRYAVRQTVFALEGEDCVYCLTQPTAAEDPLCLILREDRARLIRRDVLAALGNARPLLRMQSDDNLHETERAFFEEFAEKGPYDIFKSGINTMYMDAEDFHALLIRRGFPSDSVEPSTERFRVFQATMRARMVKDAARELLSRQAIEEMVYSGLCVLPGIYFDRPGLVALDREAIAAVCRGYADFLRQCPKMDVRLSDDTPQFLSRLCWHIKHNHHVLVQTWAGDSAVSVLAENGPLVSEFRRSFHAAWKREPVPSREALILEFETWADRAVAAPVASTQG